jgi:molybdopterin/thiamine biosynthesis adenylyltransferase
MSKRTVVIVGAGALGSHLLLFARNWDAELKAVDFDIIENKNTLAQFHTKMSLRRNKAQALQQAFQGMFGVRIQAVPHRLTADNAEQILGGADLVIDCTDNAEVRRVIQAFVRKNSVPCLHGALSGDGTFARAVWDEHFKEDEEGQEGQATCEDGQRLPFFAMAGAQIAVIAQMFLEDGKRASVQITPTGTMRLA